MKPYLAFVLCLALSAPAMALEAAVSGGAESTDRLTINSINVSRARLEELIQPKVDELSAVSAAVIECAKQGRFYNESTKSCV